MAKFKKKESTGLERRRHQIVRTEDIQDAQKENRAEMLGMFQPGDIERWKYRLMEAVEQGKPWAMKLMAEQVFGPIRTESVQEVRDVAAILREASKYVNAEETDSSYDVDVKPNE